VVKVTRDRVARAADTTRGIARSLAADIQVSRLGRTFAWTERDYRVLPGSITIARGLELLHVWADALDYAHKLKRRRK
jgi:hypothetical protein